METCDCCEGFRHNLWMDKGKVKFLPCQVCGATGTITFVYGAVGIAGLNPNIVLTRTVNKFIRK